MISPLTETLVANVNERHTTTSRKYVAEQVIVVLKWSNTFQTFWTHSSVFALEKQPKNLNFSSVFTYNRIIGGYFQKTHAPTSRKYVTEEGRVLPNWSKTVQTFWSHSYVFAFEKQPKNITFRVFLPLTDTLVTTFNETRAPTSRKYVAEQSMVMPNWSKTF